jgi:ATP-dependent DNA helicase RecG
VASTRDGFELSRIDLEQRREGDVLGAAQSGRRSSLRMLRVVRDEDVIVRARDAASKVVANDPLLESHPVLKAAVDAELARYEADYLDQS